jgi:hypothetical protein
MHGGDYPLLEYIVDPMVLYIDMLGSIADLIHDMNHQNS